MADQALLDHWQQAFKTEPPPLPDVTKRWHLAPALNPATDPLFFTPEELEARTRIRAAISHYLADDWAEYGGSMHYTEFRGRTWPVRDLIERLDYEAYEMLVRREDIRKIAALTHATVDEVEAIKARHGITY